jgi:predicted ferric reductase
MPEKEPIRRRRAGYGLIAATVLIGLLLWIGALWAADAWYENPWKYPAKVGSHTTLMLMCWAFILATRFRPVEWLFGGLDKVYKAHRYVGEAAFFLIWLHPVFLAVAFSEDIAGFFRYLWFSGDWTRNTGIIALAAFTLLVVLSIYVKIAYHRWKRTHDFFGLLLVVIVVHAFISGGEIMTFPVLTVWHGAWVAVGLAAYVYIRLLYRFVGPQYDVVTAEVSDLGDSISEVFLEPVGRPMRFRAGQFLYISFDSDAVTEEPHPFSISSPPESSRIRLSIKRLGDWTKEVDNIKRGEPARVWGPYGHFGETLFKGTNTPAVLIGGGIGITPFLSIISTEAFANRSGDTTLIYSAPTEKALVYAEEIEAAASKLPNLRFVPHVSDDEGFIDRGYLEDLLGRPLSEHGFFVCGPEKMMDSFRGFLTKAGVPGRRITMEDFNIR